MKESNMKKYAIIAISLIAIMVVGVSLAAAQEPVGAGVTAQPGANFVDEDGDGQCDLMDTGQSYGPRGFGAGSANFVDENGDGQCDLMGTGQGGNGAAGANFVDENGDGLCDLAGSGQSYGPQGQGGHGFRGGSGNTGRGMGRGATTNQ